MRYIIEIHDTKTGKSTTASCENLGQLTTPNEITKLTALDKLEAALKEAARA